MSQHPVHGTGFRPAPNRAQLAQQLNDLGVANTSDTRALLGRLATDAAALHRTIRALSELSEPDIADLPDVDDDVDAAMRRLFGRCKDQSLLRKGERIGRQNRVLLAYLIARVGHPVPLHELLVVNGLRNATSRRLRELETEHGHFSIEVTGSGDSTAYTLKHAIPDLDATAYYWLRRNIRTRKPKTIRPYERLLALLSARLGQAVPIDDLAYVLPKQRSEGKGRARTPQLAVARRVRELREEGWQVQSGKDKTRVGLAPSDYFMETLDRLPPYVRISAGVRDDALQAAERRCESCGWSPADGAQDRKKQLEVHHRMPQRNRPIDVNDPSNLQVLCNICHAGVESKLNKALAKAAATQGIDGAP
jgi:hypothetical protein